MIPTQETKHVETGRALLIEQFKNRKYVQGYLDMLMRRCQEIENVFWDIIEKRRLPIAVGHQLDMLGRLVKEERLGRTNDAYRAAIRLRIRVNRSKGRIIDIIDVALLAATVGVTPMVTEYRYLGFEVESYNQVGERHLADLLSKARAATSYGILTASDLAKSSLLVFDDAVTPEAGLETFSDAQSGTGKVAAAGYGLPTNYSGINLSLDPTAIVAEDGEALFTEGGEPILYEP